MKKALLLTLVLLIGLFLYPHLVGNSGVIAFGDSLTYGLGSSHGGGFVKMLSSDLGLPISNLGVPGDTTSSALKRIGEITDLKPAIVIILLGGNDYLQVVTEQEIVKNTEEILQKIQKSGSKIILVTLDARHTRLVSHLTDKYHAKLVPNILDDIWRHPEMMSDNIHPNDKGYALMAKRIKPELEKLAR